MNKKPSIDLARAKALYMNTSVYCVTMQCSNCSWHGPRFYSKGEPVPKSDICPACECKTLFNNRGYSMSGGLTLIG